MIDTSPPDTGRIDVHGRIGALLDLGAGFHLDLTGRENALLAGILNGVDYGEWNPATDRYLKHHFSPEDLSGKRATKRS